MKNKLLSIIVPVYKVENYLTKCVDSIIQGCKKHLNEVEIILVDDGSPDNCPQICDTLSQKYDAVKTIHTTNGGVSSARNIGIKNACGQYITFCDSDDYVTNDFERLFDHITSNPSVDVFSVGLIKNNNVISKFETQIFNPQKYSDLLKIVKLDVSICCCTKIVRKDFIIQHDLYIPSGIKSEDFAWSVNLLLKTSRYMLLDIAYYVYVDRESSVSHTFSIEGLKAQILNYRRVKDAILETAFDNKKQIKLLQYLLKGYIYMIYSRKYLPVEQKRESKTLLKNNKDMLYMPHNLKLFIYYLYLKLLKY